MMLYQVIWRNDDGASMIEWAPNAACAREARIRRAAMLGVMPEEINVKTAEIPPDDAYQLSDWLNLWLVGSWQP